VNLTLEYRREENKEKHKMKDNLNESKTIHFRQLVTNLQNNAPEMHSTATCTELLATQEIAAED
jgi:hypothetical protein